MQTELSFPYHVPEGDSYTSWFIMNKNYINEPEESESPISFCLNPTLSSTEYCSLQLGSVKNSRLCFQIASSAVSFNLKHFCIKLTFFCQPILANVAPPKAFSQYSPPKLAEHIKCACNTHSLMNNAQKQK